MSNEEEKERLKLQNEIKHLMGEIQNTKDTIFKYYTEKRKTSLLEISDDDDFLQNSDEPDIDLDLHFYKNLMEIQLKDHNETVILFPFKGKNAYGLNLKKVHNDEYIVKNVYLPPSVSLEEVKKCINHSSLDDVVDYLDELQKNIYAYYMREDHFKQLQEIMSPTIFTYHNQTVTEIELKFKIFNTQTKVRKSVTLQINYGLDTVQPNNISCKVNYAEENEVEELEELLTEHFQTLTIKDLVSGYLATFQDFGVYKFFV